MFSPALIAKFQRIIAADSPAEYLKLSAEEREQFEQWKAQVVA